MLMKMRSGLNQALGKVQTFLRETPDEYEKQFIAHNRKIWSGYRSDKSKGQILIEENRMGGCNVAMSYVASYLGRREKAKLVAFTKGISRSQKEVYSSFVDEFLFYQEESQLTEVESVFVDLLPKIATKKDLEELCVNGILIGDLIYDLFIRKLNTVTVDLASSEFPRMLRDALGYLFFWQEYFSRYSIKAVLVGHCVYPWAGIITRVAVSCSVPVYLLQPSLIYYVTQSHNMRPYNEYIDYPEFFSRLSAEEQKKALDKAKKKIACRFRGERDVGAHHLIKPTYTAKTGKRVLTESKKLKVLVASHCFSDDNHVYGNNLFPDFYEWLCFLGNISEKTDYDWYIKLHPDRYSWETQHIEEFVRKYPKFKILQADVSHHQIIEDGISCVLTVYGTIGFEYAALGVPVVTASQWNPTVAYDFNVHPKTVEDYEKVLMKLFDLRLSIDINKVYEYYFCHYLDKADDWLYDECGRVFEDVAACQKNYGSFAYRKFLNQFSEEKHLRILKTIDKFVQSKEYRIRAHIVDKL